MITDDYGLAGPKSLSPRGRLPPSRGFYALKSLLLLFVTAFLAAFLRPWRTQHRRCQHLR